MKSRTHRNPIDILPTDPPVRGERKSYLSEETFRMEREQREAEEKGHSQLAKVHAREHEEPSQTAGNDYQNDMKEHPWLSRQLFDGIDSSLNPKWDLNPEVKTELENELRDQELDKKLRLGLMPTPSSTPEFKP